MGCKTSRFTKAALLVAAVRLLYSEMKTGLSKTNFFFWLWIVLAFLVGTVLRVYMISQQILIDDEWHGMNFISGKSFSYLLTHYNRNANCIPMNLYRWLLLRTCGWSELLMRIPPLACGMLSLAVFPVMVRKILNRRATILFTFLFAISPFLIFYSRVSRAYSIITFLGFMSILSLYIWAKGGERKYAVLYVAMGALAVFFHLTAVIAVFAPLGLIFLIKLMQTATGFPRSKHLSIVPGMRELITVIIIISLLSVIFVLPPFLNNPWCLKVTRESDRVSLETLAGFACLVSGTANKPLVVLFWALVLFGQGLLLWKKPLLGGIFLFIITLYFAVLIIARWETIHAPIEFSRFCICVFPISFVLVASGLNQIMNTIESSRFMKRFGHGNLFSNLAAAIFLAILFFAGPLFEVYSYPNNFTNHSAFQESNEPLGWEQSYESDMLPGYIMKKGDLPGFYTLLSASPDTTTIVEYPVFIGNHFNLYYYYQHFHKKNVIAGYVTELNLQEWPFEDKVCGDMYFDHVLSRLSDKDKGNLHFRTMVNMLDIEELLQTPAQYIILHKTLTVEMFPRRSENQSEAQVYQPALYLTHLYKRSFGPPVFEDHNLIVFKIPPQLPL